MKYLFYFIIIGTIAACQPSESSSSEQPENTIDTIQTASGLRYFYLQKGTGPLVQKGSKVDTKLSLKVADSVVWTSYSDKDSLFTFITGTSSVIKGFEEMALLMREGDNVGAILPDSLAYGDAGSGDVIPPNATLVYDRYEITKVYEPKKLLADTLYTAIESGSVEDLMNLYHFINNSQLREEYYMDLDLTGALFRKMLKNKKVKEVEEVAIAFEKMATTTYDKQEFWYYQITAIAQQGDTTRAVNLIKDIIEKDPEVDYWKMMLKEMTE